MALPLELTSRNINFFSTFDTNFDLLVRIKKQMIFLLLYDKEKSSIAIAMVDFYFKVE